MIELLVVVLIIGILASVAMPQYFKSVEKSRSAEATGVLASIASAQERNYMAKGGYASSLDDLDVGINSLSYFTVTINGTTATATRSATAGGGLGAYQITLSIPAVPGTGARSWTCSPTGAGCASMLPQ